MQSKHKKRRTNGKPKLLTLVHRYLGLSSALFVVILSVTGLLLNHTDSMHLDTTFIQNERLLSWYGIASPRQVTSFALADGHVTAIDDQVFNNTSMIATIDTPLVGALNYRGRYVLASTDSLYLFSDDWQLIEKLDSFAGASIELRALGVDSNGLLSIDGHNGFVRADEKLLHWTDVETVTAKWSLEIDTPAALRRELLVTYRGTGLSLERILLDLHSGRLFGNIGVLVVDAAALLFLILACSGIWLWARRRKR